MYRQAHSQPSSLQEEDSATHMDCKQDAAKQAWVALLLFGDLLGQEVETAKGAVAISDNSSDKWCDSCPIAPIVPGARYFDTSIVCPIVSDRDQALSHSDFPIVGR